MPAFFQLQDLRTVVSDPGKAYVFTQPMEEVADVLPYQTLIVQVRRPYFDNPTGTNALVIEHAPILDDVAFQTLGSAFDLNGSDNVVAVFTHPLRYIRWRVSLAPTVSRTVLFLIDVVARET